MLEIMTIALSLAVQPAAASASDPGVPPEITVEGIRDPDRQIDAFVDALTDAPVFGQISRFDWAVCPAAVGLTPQENAAVVARMRRVAEAAGIKRAPAACKPNAILIVTRDKGELIERMRQQYPSYFKGLSSNHARKLARQPGPAAAWHVEGLLDRYGDEVPRDSVGGHYINEVTDTASRTSTATRPHFVSSVVVVELDALRGLTTTQLADYAAMRAFARTDPSRLEDSAAPTILTVLEAPMGTAVPVTLTEWDLGFLKALYTSSANRYAKQQRNDIERRLRRDLLDERDE